MDNNKVKDIRREYSNEALKILFKYERPKLNDIYKHLCRTNHCPVGHCDYPQGWTRGRLCPHVLSIKGIIDKILTVLSID